MKLGFGASIWVRDNHFENTHRMLDEISMVGFDGVELFHPYYFEQYCPRPQYLKQLLQMHDLELSSVYQGLTYDIPEQRERGVAEYHRRCQLAAEVGAKNVLRALALRCFKEVGLVQYSEVVSREQIAGARVHRLIITDDVQPL